MGATTGRRQRGAWAPRRPGAAGAALVAGVAALCLLGSGVARADTGTGTPPLQLGGTPLPAFTGQVLDPSQAGVPDTALDPAGGGKAAKDQPFTGFTLGAGATAPTRPDGQLLAQSNVPPSQMDWRYRATHLNVVLSMPEVAGGGAGYGCTFDFRLACSVVGRVYAKSPNERLVHGQAMWVPTATVLPNEEPTVITSTASGWGGTIPGTEQVIKSTGSFAVNGAISKRETEPVDQGVHPLTYWGVGTHLDLATSGLGLPDIKGTYSDVVVDNLVPGSRDWLGRPREDPPARERKRTFLGQQVDEIPLRVVDVAAGSREEDTTFLPEPAQLDTSVTYFQPTSELDNPRGIPRQFLDLLRQNLSAYGIPNPARMTPEQAQQVAARMTRQLADSPQLSTYLYTNARETFNRLRQQDQREQDARKQQNAPGLTIPGIPGLDLDLFRWWRGDPAHRS